MASHKMKIDYFLKIDVQHLSPGIVTASINAGRVPSLPRCGPLKKKYKTYGI